MIHNPRRRWVHKNCLRTAGRTDDGISHKLIWSWPVELKRAKKGKQLWYGNHFQLFRSCDLDLLIPKSIGVIRDSWAVPKGKAYPEIILSYPVPVTLTFDLLTPKSIGVFLDPLKVCVSRSVMLTLIVWPKNQEGSSLTHRESLY